MKDTKHIRIYVKDEVKLFEIQQQLSTVDNKLSYADVIKVLIRTYGKNKNDEFCQATKCT